MFKYYVLLDGKWEWVLDVIFYLRPDVDKLLRDTYGDKFVKYEIVEEA